MQQPPFNPNYIVHQPQTHPTRVHLVEFGEYPVLADCPHCKIEVVTVTESEAGPCTYLACAICCFFSAGICSLCPCCCRRCKDIKHRCPRCGRGLGLFKRL